jgi:amino acid transporter
MARDGVFPFSRYLRWIFKGTKTPLANVIFVFFIDSLLLLLQLASSTAFAAIIAIATLGYQISYFIPIFFRCTAARKTFPLGEFNLGRFSLPIAITSSIWLAITSVFMFFPAEYPVTKDTMNYAILIIGGVLTIAAFYWLVSARYWFVGPKRTDIDPNPLPPGHVTTENKMSNESIPDMIISRL